MSDTVYTRKSDSEYSILSIAKWLRENGTLNEDFVFIILNYRTISVRFKNDRLELAYIMQFDWTKSV